MEKKNCILVPNTPTTDNKAFSASDFVTEILKLPEDGVFSHTKEGMFVNIYPQQQARKPYSLSFSLSTLQTFLLQLVDELNQFQSLITENLNSDLHLQFIRSSLSISYLKGLYFRKSLIKEEIDRTMKAYRKILHFKHFLRQNKRLNHFDLPLNFTPVFHFILQLIVFFPSFI